MKIEILGTRGEIPASAPRYRNHSGVLVDGKILFDLGEAKFLRRKSKNIFITHLHPDHAVFVRNPMALSDVHVYAPEQSRSPFITIAKPVTIGACRVRPIPTHHSSKVKSCAYLIESGQKRVLYTGDIVWMDKKYRSRLGRLDCVVTEASYVHEGGLVRRDKTGRLYGHAGIPNIIRMFESHTNKFILTHFGSWFFKDVKGSHKRIAALGEKYGVKLIVAHDGMTFTM